MFEVLFENHVNETVSSLKIFIIIKSIWKQTVFHTTLGTKPIDTIETVHLPETLSASQLVFSVRPIVSMATNRFDIFSGVKNHFSNYNVKST